MKRITLGWLLGIAILAVAAWAAVASGPKSMPPSQLFEGSIAEIRGASAAPLGVNLSKADGSTLWLAVDPLDTVVLQGGRVARFETLEEGQRVKARYALKEGKEVARSIEITDPLPMPAPAEAAAARP